MPAGQTVISYGSVTLTRCVTTEFAQEPVYDDLSQSDLLYHRFTVKVTGYVHGFSSWCTLQIPFNPLSQPTSVHSASQQFIGMRVNLHPRQTFAMRIGAVTVNSTAQGSVGGYLALYAEPHPSTPPGGVTHLDVNNGPRCKSFVIKRVVGDNVFQVEAEFEICKVECTYSSELQPTGNASGPAVMGGAPSNSKGILSHRWTVTDSIDANLRTTRTYRGRLRTASANISANNFRYYVVPPLAQGLRRENIEFVVSPDGLNLDYTITDLEVNVSAPNPAKKWTITHTESIDQALWVRSAVDVTISSERGVAKSDLVIIGLNVVYAKVLGGRGNVANLKQFFFESLVITDYIGDEQVVSVSARVRRISGLNDNGVPKVNDAMQDWRVGAARIGKPLNPADVAPVTDPNWNQDKSFGGREDAPGTTPYYQGPVLLIGAFLPYLQTPCLDYHKIVGDAATLPTDANGTPNAAPTPDITAAVDVNWGTETDDTLLSDDAQENMYTSWKMESIYKDHSMKIALPIANSGYSSGEASTKICVLSQPQCRRIVRAEAERVGAWPQMPSPDQIEGIVGSTSGLAQTYLGMKRRFGSPFYTAGGQRAYRIAVEFFFALDRKPGDSDTLAIGRSIWTTDGDQLTDDVATAGWS